MTLSRSSMGGSAGGSDITFDATLVNPTISQTSTSNTSGYDLTIASQQGSSSPGKIKFEAGTHSLFDFSYDFSVPLITLDPSQSGLYLYAPVADQIISLSAEKQISLLTTNATGLLALQSKTITLADQNGTANITCSLNSSSATSISFSSLCTPTITQTTKAGSGATAGIDLTIKSQSGQQASSGSNAAGNLYLYAGNVGAGSVSTQDGTVYVGSGSRALLQCFWDGASAIIGAVQGTTNFNAISSGNSFTFNTYGAGVISMNAQGGFVSIAPTNYFYNASVQLGGFITAGNGIMSLQDTASATKLSWNTTGLGLYTATPVAQPSRVGSLTDSSTGTPASSVVDCTTIGVADPVKINNNNASILAKLNAIELAIHNIGLTA